MQHMIKHMTKGLILGAALFATTHAYALTDNFSPVVGADYEWTYLGGNDDWKKVFPRSYSGGHIYLGGRFWGYLGAELGYSFTNTKSRFTAFGPGDTFFGITVPAASSGSIYTSNRFREVHLDIQAFYPISNCWEVVASLGLGWVQPRIRASVFFSGVPTTVPTGPISLANSFGSGAKILARAGLGIQYAFCECWGIRGMARWKNTSSLRIKGSPAYALLAPFAGISNRPVEDSLTLSLGLFYKF